MKKSLYQVASLGKCWLGMHYWQLMQSSIVDLLLWVKRTLLSYMINSLGSIKDTLLKFALK